MSMYSGFNAKAGFNSVTLICTGKKSIVYKDGGRIYSNAPPGDLLQNTLWGTLTHQFTGKMEYFDDENNIYAYYEAGKEKIQDYIIGAIEKDGEVVSEIYGNYCGYLNFDDVRYWDARNTLKFPVKHRTTGILPSDSSYRDDLISYKAGEMDDAQNNKEKLEQIQRNDAKLRGHH